MAMMSSPNSGPCTLRTSHSSVEIGIAEIVGRYGGTRTKLGTEILLYCLRCRDRDKHKRTCN